MIDGPVKQNTELDRSDRDFLHQIGIAPDLAPRPPVFRSFLLAFAFLLACSTSVLAGLFYTSSPAGCDDFETCSTTCPGMGASALSHSP